MILIRAHAVSKFVRCAISARDIYPDRPVTHCNRGAHHQAIKIELVPDFMWHISQL